MPTADEAGARSTLQGLFRHSRSDLRVPNMRALRKLDRQSEHPQSQRRGKYSPLAGSIVPPARVRRKVADIEHGPQQFRPGECFILALVQASDEEGNQRAAIRFRNYVSVAGEALPTLWAR
jgi:hypothetical protein